MTTLAIAATVVACAVVVAAVGLTLARYLGLLR